MPGELMMAWIGWSFFKILAHVSPTIVASLLLSIFDNLANDDCHHNGNIVSASAFDFGYWLY